MNLVETGAILVQTGSDMYLSDTTKVHTPLTNNVNFARQFSTVYQAKNAITVARSTGWKMKIPNAKVLTIK